MPNLHYKDEVMAKIYREERMREAELERLIRQKDAQKPKRSNLLNIVLVRLGKQLVIMGTRLQKKEMSRKPS